MTFDEKPFESHYHYFETTIDHPVERVWPHALNIGSWMSDHRLVPLSGKAGEVGYFEKVHARDIGAAVPLAHHHYYGIAEIVPLKYIALEVFPEKGGSYGNPRQWIGFDGILLVDLGGRTQVIVLLMVVNPGAVKEERKVQAPQQVEQETEATRAQLERYFDNLRRRCETG